MRMFKPKERVFCGKCKYFKDDIKWHQRKCLFSVTIRTDYNYREKKEVTIYQFPQVKNSHNDCGDFKEKGD